MLAKVLHLLGLLLALTSSLSWTRLEGADECIAAPELAKRVEERVGGAVLVPPSEAQLSIEGRVVRAGKTWRAVIALARASGEILWERTLETREPGCRALDDALVLVIALSLDPSGAPPPPPPPEQTPRVIVKEVVREVRVAQPWHVGARAGMDVEVGALPSPMPGASVAVLIDAPGLPPLELGAFGTPSTRADAELADRGVDVGMVGGAVAVCPRYQFLGASIGMCAGVRLGWMTWEGDGFEEDVSGGLLVPAGTFDARLELPLFSRVFAVIGAGVRVPFRRASIGYERSAAAGGGTEELFQPLAATLWANLGLLVTIL